MAIDIATAGNYDRDGNTGTEGDSGTHWPGGTGNFAVSGTHSGTTKLQCNPDSMGWVDVGGEVSFTANGIGAFQLAPCQIRIVSGGGTGLQATIKGPIESP